MMNSKWFHKFLSAAILLVMVFSSAMPAAASPSTAPAQANKRYIMVAKSDADFAQMRADAIKNGATIVKEIPQTGILVVTTPATLAPSKLATSSAAQSVVPDRIEKLVKPQAAQEMGFNATPGRNRINLGQKGIGPKGITPDPAFAIPGLMWDFNRINAPQAWKKTGGDSAVIVGVADTGLDYTNAEIASKVLGVVDFTDSLCKDYYGASDADMAATYSGPADTDWNGHGTWIGGNIAGAADGLGINGIAPKVGLVALKIAQWCGSTWDSSILDAFTYAADHNIDIVSISFGGYLDRTDPEQEAIYQAYVTTVKYAKKHGTVIVAAAGNDHVRIGAGGQVISHGPLTVAGTAVADFQDYYGLWETPGGIPGVVMVSATGNVVNAPSKKCPDGTAGDSSNPEATCKPSKDAHQPYGVGRQNQLTYYSNYGPRIDVAAPGGARKFNLPSIDRGGTGGFPYVITEGFQTWETFSITSNWALEIPCYYNIGIQFYQDTCYSTIQGTSMATPHVSGVLAMIASANPRARHNVDRLVDILKDSAQHIGGNTTPALSATDLSAGDRTGLLCYTGYCHLGGPAIRDSEAYGAGLIDTLAGVSGR